MHPWPERAAQSVALLHRYSREEIDEALALKEANGWSYRKLAAYMGVSNCTAYRWQHGNPPKPSKTIHLDRSSRTDGEKGHELRASADCP
jgi:hypothetical protein